MDNTKINMLCAQLQSLTNYDTTRPIPFDVVLSVREGITEVAQRVSDISQFSSRHLMDLKNTLFTEIAFQQFYINPVVYGQILEFIEVVRGQFIAANQADCGDLCHLLHPSIRHVSEKLYRDGSYAEAACNAFIEINSRLKEIYCEKCPDLGNVPDGQALMNKVFADNNPVLEAGNLTTQTGRDIQAGTRFMFAGAMAALRNPKSHENITLGKEDSMRRLIFASMLMFRIDEIIAA